MNTKDKLKQNLLKTLEKEVKEKQALLDKAIRELDSFKILFSNEEVFPEPVLEINRTIPVARKRTLSKTEQAFETERIRQHALKMQKEFTIRDLVEDLYDEPVSKELYMRVRYVIQKMVNTKELSRQEEKVNIRGGVKILYKG